MSNCTGFGCGGVGGGGSGNGTRVNSTNITVANLTNSSFGFPTSRPTPSFTYQPYGDSSFGYKWQDQYSYAWQYAIRRPGWSWSDPKSGLGPFCYLSTCYNVTNVCQAFGGTLLHSSVCSFPDDVKVAGPSCWQGNCVANGTAVCNAVQGSTIGVADGVVGPQWCIFSGQRTLIGPTCYGDSCFPDDGKTSCDLVKGKIWNNNFCFVDGYYTVAGPLCWSSSCLFGDAQLQCSTVGTLFAKRWCIIQGCDRTVIGPTCTNAQSALSDQCFDQTVATLCKTLGGVDIGDRYCIIPGTKWTFIGPASFKDSLTIGPTNDFCRQLSANLVGFFNNMVSYSIAGQFCLVKARIPTSAPFCTNDGCNLTAGAQFCSRFQGKTLASGFMCSLCDSYRQVVGPLMWNGTLLVGDPKYCEGAFCAIPNRREDVNTNLRCPASDSIVSTCGGTTINGADTTFFANNSNVNNPNGGGGGGGGGDGSGGTKNGTNSTQKKSSENRANRRLTGLVICLLLLSTTHVAILAHAW